MLRDIQNSAGLRPWAAWANLKADPALSGRLNQAPSRDPFQPEVFCVGL